MRLRADLTLLLVAVIWGSAFAAQRIAAQQMGAHTFNGLRYLLAVAVLLPLAWRGSVLRLPPERKDQAGIGLAGLLLFGGAYFQQAGLEFTTAGNAGFITGLYVVIIPLLLALVWRRRLHRSIWAAATLAAAGLFLLSTGGTFHLNPGDALELVSAGLWALHVIWIGRMVQRVNVLQLAIGQNLLTGALSLAAALIWEPGALPAGPGFWGPIVYTGVLSLAIGYTLQAAAQRHAPPADAAIILSLEAVFAALLGWLLLEERLGTIQLLGCGLMLVGMLIAQVGGMISGSPAEKAGKPAAYTD